jgi:hypothetical protein
MLAPQTLAGEIDVISVVYEAVEDGVGISRVADKACHFIGTGVALHP